MTLGITLIFCYGKDILDTLFKKDSLSFKDTY